MNIGNRIRILRKQLKLSQAEFGNKIGLKPASISDLETGRTSITERNIKSICSEFNVDYIWLTTGEGEMFSSDNDKEDDEYQTLIDNIMTGENEFHKTLFKKFIQLDESELKALEGIIDKFLETKNNNK